MKSRGLLSQISKWCLPAKIYLVMMIINVITNLDFMRKCSTLPKEDEDIIMQKVYCSVSLGSVVKDIVIQGLILYLMLSLCSKKYMKLAWALLLFPFALFLILIFALVIFLSSSASSSSSPSSA